MAFRYMEGSGTPPPAGQSSGGYSTAAMGQYADKYGQPVNVPAAGSSGGGGGSQNFPYLYMGKSGFKGTNANTAEYGLAIRSAGGDPTERIESVIDAQNRFMDSGNKNIRHWALLLALAGYADGNGQSAGLTAKQAIEASEMVPMTTVFAWHAMFLTEAADMFGSAGKKITPSQYLKKQLEYRLGDKWDGNLKTLNADKVSGLAGGSTTTHTQTSRSVDYMNPADAKAMVRDLLQQQLQRDPTQAEYEDFIASLHRQEGAHPSTSTTTMTMDALGNETSRNTRTKQGIGAAGLNQLMYEKLKKQPNWGEWQAVGTYMPAFYAALDASVGGV